MRQYLPSIGRTRAVLAAAIAASLLLPFSGGSATVASAAPGPLTATMDRARSQDGLVRLALVPGQNEAKYILTVKTLGAAPKQAACATRDVTGEIVLNPDGSVVTELSKVTVDQRTFKCEAPLRDNMAQQLLNTAEHPHAVFLVKSTPGLTVPLGTGDVAFQLIGEQTVKGVTQPTTYDTTANMTPEAMTGLARTNLKMSSFDIKPPSIGPLLQVADEMVAEVTLSTTIGAPAQ